MLDLRVKNQDGLELELTNNSCYTISKIEGVTPPQVNINTSVNTTFDGSTVNSIRLESRNIVITLKVEGAVEENRINLYKYFPLKEEITLYFKHGLRDVYIKGIVESLEADLFTARQEIQISLMCNKPYFKNINCLMTTFSELECMFEFPFSIEEEGIEFSTIGNERRRVIYNDGESETGVIIRLVANDEVVNPVVYDIVHRTYFKLNCTLQALDEIIINTNVGEKSVTRIRNGVHENIIGCIDRGSTWHKLKVGRNVFDYRCESGLEYLDMTFTIDILYGGV